MWRRALAVLQRADWYQLIAIFALLAFGTAAIYSISLSEPDEGVLLLQKQIFALVLGLGVYVFVAMSNYRLLRGYALVLYGLSIALLVCVLLFGQTIRGTTGWFSLGVVHFQPVEFAKIALILLLARFLPSSGPYAWDIRTFLKTLACVVVPAGLTLLQPDFGSAALLVLIWFGMIVMAGLPWRAIIATVLLGVVACTVGWVFLFADYQKERVLTFLHPELDPLGQGYNVTQAMIAIGSGGWFGQGLGVGSQSQLKFLPERQTDFIFAVVAEELGVAGVTVLLLAAGTLSVRLLLLARRSSDSFTAYALTGVWVAYLGQTAVNVGMNMGLLPVTGLALPLVSYGGSSLLFTLLMLGIAQSVAVRGNRRL